jgi:hypothetical protein
MGYDVKLYVVIFDAEALLVLPLNVGPLFLNEAVQALGILNVVASPVVVELEAREVIGAVVDIVQGPVLVSIAADA